MKEREEILVKCNLAQKCCYEKQWQEREKSKKEPSRRCLVGTNLCCQAQSYHKLKQSLKALFSVKSTPHSLCNL